MKYIKIIACVLLITPVLYLSAQNYNTDSLIVSLIEENSSINDEIDSLELMIESIQKDISNLNEHKINIQAERDYFNILLIIVLAAIGIVTFILGFVLPKLGWNRMLKKRMKILDTRFSNIENENLQNRIDVNRSMVNASNVNSFMYYLWAVRWLGALYVKHEKLGSYTLMRDMISIAKTTVILLERLPSEEQQKIKEFENFGGIRETLELMELSDVSDFQKHIKELHTKLEAYRK